MSGDSNNAETQGAFLIGSRLNNEGQNHEFKLCKSTDKDKVNSVIKTQNTDWTQGDLEVIYAGRDNRTWGVSHKQNFKVKQEKMVDPSSRRITLVDPDM